MRLTLQRERKDAAAIAGTLYVDGVRECVTMERTDVAISAGEYPLEITYSPHFRRPMPLLDGVLRRSNIRIHPANWPTQLEGCIAVGLSHDGDDLDNSVAAFNPLFTKILTSISQLERVTIVVVDIPLGSSDESSNQSIPANLETSQSVPQAPVTPGPLTGVIDA